MKLKQEFFVREIDGKTVLIPSDPAVRSRINRLELNEAGSFLFNVFRMLIQKSLWSTQFLTNTMWTAKPRRKT